MKTVTAMLATAAFFAADVSASTGEIAIAFEQDEPTLAFRLRQDYGDEYGDEYGNEFEEDAEDGAEEEADEEDDSKDSKDSGKKEKKPDSEKTVAELIEELDPLNQAQLWKWSDFAFGITVGLWAPYMQRARDYDCFSEMMQLGLEVMDWHLVFENKFDTKNWQDWLFVGTRGLSQFYGGFRSLDVCLDQYSFSKGNPWAKSMLAEPNVQKKYKFRSEVKDGFDPLFDTVYLLAILGNAFDAYNAYFSSGRYMYHFGHNLALGTMRLVVFIDKIGADLISPSKPWVRYHD